MAQEILEILITDDGKILIYPSAPLAEEIALEIGQLEFDFTPYCG